MAYSLYSASVPVFTHMLTALRGVLDKAAAHAAAKKIEEATLTSTRLIADMLPLSRQVVIATDFAKLTTQRLSGVEAPKWDPTEVTIAELQTRIDNTLAYLATVTADQVNAAAGRTIKFNAGPLAAEMVAEQYLPHYALANFFFHTSMAYAILRENGVDLGKRDFLGPVPGFSVVQG